MKIYQIKGASLKISFFSLKEAASFMIRRKISPYKIEYLMPQKDIKELFWEYLEKDDG